MTKLTWEDIEKMTDELSAKIKASGFKPDYIIGLTIGGLIPLYFMVRKLDNDHKFLTIAVNSYNKNEKGDLKISYLPETDLSNKKVLFVDEIVGTGDSLKEVSNILIDKYKVGELKTATLVVLKDSQFYPDFYYLKADNDWVVFPWDRHEFPEYFKDDIR